MMEWSVIVDWKRNLCLRSLSYQYLWVVFVYVYFKIYESLLWAYQNLCLIATTHLLCTRLSMTCHVERENGRHLIWLHNDGQLIVSDWSIVRYYACLSSVKSTFGDRVPPCRLLTERPKGVPALNRSFCVVINTPGMLVERGANFRRRFLLRSLDWLVEELTQRASPHNQHARARPRFTECPTVCHRTKLPEVRL
jgi:hypothetical protein